MTRRKDGLYQQIITINGKRKCFYGHTQAEVARKIAAYNQEREHGHLFREVAEAWQAEREQEVRYKTAESYKAPVKRLCAHFGDTRITEITSPQIAAYIRHFAKDGYSKRTVQQTLDILRMIFRYAIVEMGELAVNPCDGVSVPRDLPVTHRGLPKQEDIQAVFAHADDDRFSLLPFFLCCTGLRLGEALAVTDEDFGGGIRVNKKVSWQPNQPVIDEFLKTDKGVRVVPLLDILSEHMPNFKGYLFSNDGEKPYSKSEFTKRWAAYAKRTGVSCDRHTLRHYFATMMYDAGVDTKEAADIMGHDEAVMRGIYTHITEARRESTISKLNDFVSRSWE